MKKNIFLISFLILLVGNNLVARNFSETDCGIKNENTSSEYYLTDKKDEKMKNLISAQYGDRPNISLEQYNSEGTKWSWGKMFSGLGIVGSIILRGIL